MVRSAKGKEVNMVELAKKHAKDVALGNAHMNANGDLLGRGGKVVKTRAELATEYHTKGTNKVKNVPLSDEITNMMGSKKVEKPVVDSTNKVNPKKKKK